MIMQRPLNLSQLFTSGWLIASVLIGCGAVAAEPPTLRMWLKDNSFIDGQLVPSNDEGEIGLVSPLFDRPIEFDIRGLRSVAGDYSPPEPESGHAFLLEGGTRISGQLKQWTDTHVVVDSPSLGEITLDKSLLRVVEAIRDSGKRVYSGPKSIDDWNILDDTGKWQFAAGALTSPDNEARAAGNVNLPGKFRLVLSMSWQGRADFVLSLGCKQPRKPSPQPKNRRAIVQSPQENAAVRLEMWDAQLAVVREVGNLADIAVLPLDDGISKFELVFYVDQIEGLVAVYSPRGKMLEKIKVSDQKGIANKFALLENHGKSVSVSRFDVFEWDGHLPDSTEFPDGYVLDTDDVVSSSTVTGYDAKSGTLDLVDLKDAKKTGDIALKDVRRIILAANDSGEKEAESADKDDESADKDDRSDSKSKEPSGGPKFEAITLDEMRLIEVDFADTSRLVGYLAKSSDGKFTFFGNGIAGKFQADVDQVVAISGSGKPFRAEKLPGVVGELVTDQSRLQGCLVKPIAGGAAADSSVLTWRPCFSSSNVAISIEQSGSIDYAKTNRNSAPVARPSAVPAAAKPKPAGALNNLIAGVFSARPNRKPGEPAGESSKLKYEIVFRSGDTIDGYVRSVDQRGVTFESDETSTTFVPHEQMDSITLGRMISKPNFDETELKRLLTVPRSRKSDPPTHLFVSTTGDYLRGRLIGVNEKLVGAEVRLDVQEIPRENVARVIWLHERPWLDAEDDKKMDEAAKAAQADQSNPFLVHAVRQSKRGVTFEPTNYSDGTLKGTSELLGDCSVSIDSVASLLFGRDVGIKALALRKESWTLSLAALPKAYLDSEGSGDSTDASMGKLSPLVGKDAPEIKLQTIDDVEFLLSENRDKVIVLDFWASWCGPCIATMPKVEEIVAEYDPRKVELVAVNLQDSVEKARVALKRMEIEPTVVMDVDGEAAQFYDAKAIPQTVIVDTKGKITHLFVGGGAKFLEQFSVALKEVVEAQ